MRATVTTKGQVTIPKALRDALGLEAGTILDFRREDDRVVVTKVLADDPVAAVYGLAADGRRTDDVMNALRGEPEG